MTLARRSAVLVAIALAAPLAAATAASPDPPEVRTQLASAARAAAWGRLQALAGNDATVRWSAVDDVPISLRMGARGISLTGFAADHAAAVRALFHAHAELFRLRSGIDEFVSEGEREQGGIHHLRMTQWFRGVRVRGGEYMVSVGSDSRVQMMGGRSVPDVDADVVATLTDGQAIRAACARLGVDGSREPATATLAIEPREGPDLLVYQVRMDGPGRGQGWEVLVDAHDGSIVGSHRRALGASGCAAVWDPSPLVALREKNFSIADPTAGSGAVLAGANVRVLHETAPQPASDSLRDGCFDFHFDPVTQPESFDQVNVYSQVDHYIREFLGGNGFPGLPQPMTVILRQFQCGDANTGETIGSTVWLTSAGCGYKSSTRDADVIDHETQHVINNFYGLEGGLDLDREIYATALHESFANYFSCAAHDDPVYAEYFFGPQGFANCNSDPAEYNYSRRFELGIGQLQNYLVGMIWSGALWDIRMRIGPVIDRIVLESLFYLPAQPSMHTAVDAVLQADRDQHGGAHQTEMIAAFAGRGLGPGLPQVSIGGPSQQAFGEPGTWTADVCCGPRPWTYQWSRVVDGSSLIEPLGTDSSVTFVSPGSFQLRLRVVDGEGHPVLSTLNVRIVTQSDLSVQIEGPQLIVAGVPHRWTARVSGQGALPVAYRWTYGPGVFLGDSISLTATISGTTTLKVLVGVPGKTATAQIPVAVDGAPLVSIAPLVQSLVPGQTVSLTGDGYGGKTPYTWRWTRNGIGPEHLIATTQTIQVTGDSLEFDLYLVVTTALGTKSNPYQLTISPSGIPLVTEIQGPDQIRYRSSATWEAVLPEGTPPTVAYQWTRTCVDPGCAPGIVGTGRTLTLESARSFDLDLMVSTGARVAFSHRQIRARGLPDAPAAVPGASDPGDPAAGPGARRVPDHPAFSLDRTVAREGGELTFTLEASPGSSATLRLLDISGREVATVFEGSLPHGVESVSWRSVSLPSGVYIAVARIAGRSIRRRIVLIR